MKLFEVTSNAAARGFKTSLTDVVGGFPVRAIWFMGLLKEAADRSLGLTLLQPLTFCRVWRLTWMNGCTLHRSLCIPADAHVL